MDKKAKKVIKEALEVLGKKNVSFIAHAGSFPSKEGKNTGFGTFNSQAGHELIEYLSGLFTAVQLGPGGKTKSVDASPYAGTIFSANPLFIDLESLTTDDFENILSISTYRKICDENPSKNVNRTAYSYIYEKQNVALKEAFYNFKEKKPSKFVKKFNKFKKDNAYWLENDALYEALSIEHGNDYFPAWDNEIDKNLLNPSNDEEKKRFAARRKEIEEKHADDIEFYSFVQFLAAYQSEQTKKFALKKKIKLTADRQVAFSDRDVWAYKSLFLDGYMLGCPPDYFSKDGQAWGFPVINPEKMFNKDGSLGEAGKLLKALYKKMFNENPGGVRIDHIVGLIDPWVYKSGHKPKPEEGAGRLYSSPEHEFLSRFAIATLNDLNEEVTSDKEARIKSLTDKQIDEYGALLEKIVIKAAEEEGADKDSIVCEDLGTLTYPVASVMKKLDLQGMCLTQFVVPDEPDHAYRCKNIKPRSWVMAGTHDNEPIAVWADKTVNTHEGWLHGQNLAEDLYPDASDEERNEIAVRLSKDANFLTFLKFVELFASKAENVQIFFTDYFGIKETYNRPGTSGDENWSLEIPADYPELYAKTPQSFDFAAVLKAAIIARGKDFADEHQKLIKKLDEIKVFG